MAGQAYLAQLILQVLEIYLTHRRQAVRFDRPNDMFEIGAAVGGLLRRLCNHDPVKERRLIDGKSQCYCRRDHSRWRDTRVWTRLPPEPMRSQEPIPVMGDRELTDRELTDREPPAKAPPKTMHRASGPDHRPIRPIKFMGKIHDRPRRGHL